MTILRQRLPATVFAVPQARHTALAALREAGYTQERLLEDVALAVSEAVGNVARHAYPDATGEVELEVGTDDEGVVVVVSDGGIGAGEPSDTPGLGLGLPLIKAKTRSWQLDSDETGTRVTMRFGGAG
ncbi:MAG TPA: ATP-binding protein [Gaiellales bacterium]|jgi:serine/threonine-protein kinase RsbW|nr:ATP-binding protein [Gaiellales bacterium]